MRCSACDSDAPAGSRFCPRCASPLAGSVKPTLTVAVGERPPSTDSLDGARFIPGTMLADRYRIVGLIGRGGMGEVYRAEDLKLGQPVALKFLPEDVAGRPDRLARFHQEVRVARQVSHPNVCRVYDIGEADSGTAGPQNRLLFLTMEYVDGEDLASLLRRIGRLPADKALELARQLCAGLAAAHDRGVLHRDLKPANVLIDGRGRARIADFGLAGLADEWHDRASVGGTPAYMAPEQLTGHAASTRTDIYALGLVLYEMFTGNSAFKGSADVFARLSDDSRPTSPSTLIADLDPAVERIILRCLERDPAHRPASALSVAAALPGGDPLAAALAAGETPSPDIVAAAGEVGSLSPAKGIVCLVAILVSLMPLGWLTKEATLAGLVPLEKGPAVLAERARTVAQSLGYVGPRADEAYGFATDDDYLRYVDEHDRSANKRRVLKTGRPSAVVFWYRQSPFPFFFAAIRATGRTRADVTPQFPPQILAGMVSIRLDPSGRLVGLEAVPEGVDTGATTPAPPDWTALFAAAGLPMAQFRPRPPAWIPPVYADARAAWDGVYPERPEIPIRIEAAAAAGKPVYFEIVAPWTPPPALFNRTPPPAGSVLHVFALFAISLVVFVFGGAFILARRNLRLGRGDRRGGYRLGLYVFAISMLSSRIDAGIAGFFMLVNMLPAALAGAAFTFLMYIAIEPDVRRVWPETMVGWCRVLAGRVHDPLVGRDILIGTLAGVGLSCFIGLSSLIQTWLGVPQRIPVSAFMSDLLRGGADALFSIAAMTLLAMILALASLVLLFLLSTILRSRLAIAGLLVVGIVFIFNPVAASGNLVVRFLFASLGSAGLVYLLVRFGLLPASICWFVTLMIGPIPLTLDSSVPYASSSYLILATIVILAVYGFRTAVAGQPVLGSAFLKGEPV